MAPLSFRTRLAWLALGAAITAGCGGGGGSGPTTAEPVAPPAPAASPATSPAPSPAPAPAPSPAPAPAPTTSPASAFLYQDVTPSGNSVRIGLTTDGHTITAYQRSVLTWQVRGTGARPYGDPVFSRLANGRWQMTANTPPGDARGSMALLIHEGACPVVDEAAVRALSRSSAAGCEPAGNLAMAKTSQAVEHGGSRYLFHMADGKVMLMRLTDATRGVSDLSSICVRRTAATTLADLAWGESTTVLDGAATGLLLSDAAAARRADGTWALFVKGIASNSGCSGGRLCELCSRSIWRTTSSDLIRWSPLEKVVDQASVPDASLAGDGRVWLYWQDFGPTCKAQNLALAARAPIRGGPELDLASAQPVRIPDEPFEANTQLHYPTNGNPVLLPDAAARSTLEACLRP
ncbi:hypothetical protein [Ramlibacter sp.]|uniref:hypothetical protein n=1 Tax=Ramlibacter sp. TaxID=1917967 RepID=UPI0035B4583D